MNLQRCPMYLRVVEVSLVEFDALDQPEDTPQPGERVHVYRIKPGTRRGPVFICRPARGRGGRQPEDGDYEHMPEIDGEQFRETEAWRAWAMAQPPIE